MNFSPNARYFFTAAALAIGAVTFTSDNAPAEAAGCYYKAYNPEGRYLNIRGVGHAAKKKWACNRARMKCNNRLERALKKGTFRTSTSRGYQCKKSG
ncbi:MAG: hypothetical protein ABJM29_06005 [Rhizobiaceae bacterium]